MVLLLILIISEILTIFVFRKHFKGISRTKYYISTLINAVLSIYMWILYIEVSSYHGNLDNPSHIWLTLNLAGTYCAVLFPRVILDILHFTGKIFKPGRGSHSRSMTNAGIIIWIIIFSIISLGTIGRFNARTVEVNVKVKGLNKELEGLTIVQISDCHLSGFQRNRGKLKDIMENVTALKPDILINSGDFVNYGWKEFDRSDTILSVARSRLGNFAVLGNHDIGTYYPGFTESDIDSNMVRMVEKITASGYRVLNDENIVLNVGGARVELAGVISRGKHAKLIHGDLKKAIECPDSIDFKILITHDPNQWIKEVAGKTDIDLTLSGHTHGMQMGIITKWFKWSPAEYIYPRWNGLYSVGEQYLYVNRGLGVSGIPFRIWMPPEITVIRLSESKE